MKPIGSKRRSSAAVARTLEVGRYVARVTKTIRAASPPFATKMLLRPEPATVALSASHSDGDPAARRRIHQRTPRIRSERKLTTIAAARRGSDAERIDVQA